MLWHLYTAKQNYQTITNDDNKATTFNDQFSFAFTQDIYHIPHLAPRIYSDIPFLEIGIA